MTASRFPRADKVSDPSPVFIWGWGLCRERRKRAPPKRGQQYYIPGGNTRKGRVNLPNFAHILVARMPQVAEKWTRFLT